jgi:hypothetical protein
MNVEVFSYSLFTTVLGMLVVFLSLTGLSLMMVLLKGIFSAEENNVSQRTKAGAVGADRARRVVPAPSGQQLPGWVPVAVAVYLAQEQEPERPSADPWNAIVNQYDPWVSAGRFDKRRV